MTWTATGKPLVVDESKPLDYGAPTQEDIDHLAAERRNELSNDLADITRSGPMSFSEFRSRYRRESALRAMGRLLSSRAEVAAIDKALDGRKPKKRPSVLDGLVPWRQRLAHNRVKH